MGCLLNNMTKANPQSRREVEKRNKKNYGRHLHLVAKIFTPSHSWKAPTVTKSTGTTEKRSCGIKRNTQWDNREINIDYSLLQHNSWSDHTENDSREKLHRGSLLALGMTGTYAVSGRRLQLCKELPEVKVFNHNTVCWENNLLQWVIVSHRQQATYSDSR